MPDLTRSRPRGTLRQHRHSDKIAEYEKAGYTHVYVHQVGPDQEGFLSFCKRELLGSRPG